MTDNLMSSWVQHFYVTVTDHWRNFKEVYTEGSLQDLGAGYDFGSLMHYRLCAMTNNSWPTIEPKVFPAQLFKTLKPTLFTIDA